MTQDRLNKGLVIVFTGIEGRSTLNRKICDGLAEGGVDYAIKLEDWTLGVPGPGAYLVNERYENRNREEAAKIADGVMNYRASHPGRPVFLVGQSGGGAMAIWTAEAMPFGYKVDGVVCLSASLSPEYRLDEALRKSERGIINFYSHSDWLFLWLGTSAVGTMDGEHGSSAGRVGFYIPRPYGRAPAGYSKLYQVAWTDEMVRAGNYGGHLSGGGREFIREFVAPLVVAPRWTDKTADEVIARAADMHPSKPTIIERVGGLLGHL